jgi:phosphonate metabolism protein (transferase hexapeptide repeat family)
MQDPTTSQKLSETPYTHPTAYIEQSELGKWTEVAARSSIIETVLGDYSYVMNDCDLIYATIGKFCSLASHCRLNPGNHPLQRAALHHFTYRSNLFDLGEDDTSFFEWRRKSPVTLGNDVWIGHGAVLLPGVVVGDGAVVGAGAVVTKEVAPFTIVAGVPATTIRPRFPAWVAESLTRISWWNWDHQLLKERLGDFRQMDAESFVRKYDPRP